MSIETVRSRSLRIETVIETQRALAGKIGRPVISASRRLMPIPRPERRRKALPLDTAIETLREYEGRLAIIGGSGNVSYGKNKEHASEAVSALADVGILEASRAIGIAAISSKIADTAADQYINLKKNAEHIGSQIIGKNIVTDAKIVPQPVVISSDRPGNEIEQAYGGVSRAIRSFEKSLDDETLAHRDQVALVTLISPRSASKLLAVPDHMLTVGTAALLNRVGSTPEENEWEPIDPFSKLQ